MRIDGNVAGIRLCRTECVDEDDYVFFLVIEGIVFEMSWGVARKMWSVFIDSPGNDEGEFREEKFLLTYADLANVVILCDLIKNNLHSCADVFGYSRFEKPTQVLSENEYWYNVKLDDGNKARLFKTSGSLFEPNDTMNFWNRVVQYGYVRGDFKCAKTELIDRYRTGSNELDSLFASTKFPDLTAEEVVKLVAELRAEIDEDLIVRFVEDQAEIVKNGSMITVERLLGKIVSFNYRSTSEFIDSFDTPKEMKLF